MKSISIAAIIVTYNRKNLLIESLEAVLAQSSAPDMVYIVDNASTDGTQEHLSTYGYLKHAKVTYLQMERNVGGAGGFYHGIKTAYEGHHDYFWLMDDDCIPSPTALKTLLFPINNLVEEIGFVSSRVNWVDGKPHRMNLPMIKPLINKKPFNEYEEIGCLSVVSSSFVSVLITKNTIKKVGLPIKEMFIWGDDVEYLSRITKSGFLGLYCGSSVVVHKTTKNQNDDIYLAKADMLWKYKYGIRNDLYNIRIQKGILAYLRVLFWRLTWLNWKLLSRRPDAKLKTVFMNISASISSFFFTPSIVYIND